MAGNKTLAMRLLEGKKVAYEAIQYDASERDAEKIAVQLGVPPEQVIGSSIKTEFEMRDDGPVLMRRPEIDFIDDKAGKPVGIHKFIGQRPLAAFGNSDGDLQMLQWTTAGAGPRLGVIVRHTDAEREWAYDRDSHIGKLDKALDEAPSRGWVVIDIQNDWAQVFPRLTY